VNGVNTGESSARRLGGVAEDIEVDQVARSLDQQGILGDEEGLGHLDAHCGEQRERCVRVVLEHVG
jgi:hypothetical protein